MLVLALFLSIAEEGRGQSGPLTVAVTGFSGSTGATLVATGPAGTSTTLEYSPTIGGIAVWSVLAGIQLDANGTRQYQDTGATGVPQRYYRLRNALWLYAGAVYSVNYAALAKRTLGTGMALLSNPLLATNGTVASGFKTPVNGYSLFRLTQTGFEANNYLYDWTSPTMPFNPGEGFFLNNASGAGATLVFYGEVPLGTLTVPIPEGPSLLSSKVPQSGALESQLGFPADYDIVHRWNAGLGAFDTYVHFPEIGWDPSEPNLGVGEAFWLETDSARNWTRTFSPNFAPQMAGTASQAGTGASFPTFTPSGGSPVQVNFFTFNSTASLGRVFDTDGSTLVGPAFVGQLFAGASNSEGSLATVGTAVAFQSGQAAGRINSGLVSVPGISAGQSIYLQLRVWESAKGATYAAAVANGSKAGKSAIFSVTAVAPPDNGPVLPPPSANGFSSFSLAAPPAVLPFVASLDGAQDGGGGRQGSGAVALSLSGSTLTLNGSFAGLSGTVTSGGAHIHGPASPGSAASVLYSIFSLITLNADQKSGTISGTVNLVAGTGGYDVATQVGQLTNSLWYLNIHTATFSGGEIRGQIVPTAAIPSVLISPRSQTNATSSNVTFSVVAGGTPPLFYQWYFNTTTKLTGATNASLSLTNLQLTNAGGYRVVVTNSFGSATSSVATLTVYPVDDRDSDGMPNSWEALYGLNPDNAFDAQSDFDADGVSNRDEYLADTNPINAASYFQISSVALVGGGSAQVTVGTRPGLTYSVQYMNSLEDPVWIFLGQSLAGGSSLSILDPGPLPSRRFYRALAQRTVNAPPVYSVNMAGFANVRAAPGSNWLAVPFFTPLSTVDVLIPSPPEGSCIVKSGGLSSTCFFEGTWDSPGISLVRGEPFEFHNPLGTDFTLTFVGEVGGKPVIVQQPTDTTAVIGGVASLQVGSVGALGMGYQWRFNVTNTLANGTNATLSLSNVQATAAGAYQVVITNSLGAVTSVVVALTVLQCLPPPTGLVAWWSGEGNALDTLGASDGTFQNGASYVQGRVGQAFHFTGNNRVQVSDGPATRMGTNSFTFEFWVRPNALFGTEPESGIRLLEKSTYPGTYFVVDFSPTGRVEMEMRDSSRNSASGVSDGVVGLGIWNHVAIVVDRDQRQIRHYLHGIFDSQSMLPSTFTNNLDVPNVPMEIGSRFNSFRGDVDEFTIHKRALTENEITAIYAAGSVGMCKPPVQVLVGGQLVNTNALTVTNSAMVSFQTGYAGGHIFDTLNGTHPGGGTLYSGPFLVSTSVVVRAIAYTADFSQSAESDPLTITVVRAPFITQQPQSQSVLSGQAAFFSAPASGDVPLSYQWFFNGSALAGATASSFARSAALLSHEGSYWVVASNAYGRATSAVAGLTVLLRPSVLTQPSGTNVNSGQSATFCVSVIGSAPLLFQWRRNGVNLPGATNACYAVTNVQATNAGAYSVVVGNGADAVTSAEAVLTVADLPNGPPAEDNFANRNGLFGNSGALEVNNIGATKEPSEPDHAGKAGGASVWYRWTPDNAGIATLRTSGSAFDTLLAVYRGDTVDALSLVAANEDGGGFLTSEARFNATNTVPYQIAVDGFAAAQGSFVLSWNLEPTAQSLPDILTPPLSQTVTQGAAAPFGVSATGNGLTYQWHFNGTRISGATNLSFTRSNVQPADVGYYAVAVTNSQGRGLLSDAAVLEIGPFANVRSVDKVEDLLGGPAPFQPAAAGAASVAIGTLGTQILNTTNSTTSFRETNHCGVIGGSSRWFKLQPAANGLLAIDTFGSAFDTVLASYTGNPLLGGYPTKLIACNNDADPAGGLRWSRVLHPATNATDYLIAVDGATASAAGTVQLNWSLGLPPVIVSNPPASTPTVGEGATLQLATALTNGLPPPRLQWYLDGAPIADATNATYQVSAAARQSGGIYTVVAYNPVGSVTSTVANVTIEVPLELNLQPVQQNGRVHFRVSGVASQTFILQGSTNLVHWQPLYTNSAAGAPVTYDDTSTTNRSRRYYRALPWP
jgi:hypothetical protein